MTGVGGCVIHDASQGWLRYTFDGAQVDVDQLPFGPGDSCIFQGRPLAGSSLAHPMYAAHDSTTPLPPVLPSPAIAHERDYQGDKLIARYMTILNAVNPRTDKFQTCLSGTYGSKSLEHVHSNGNTGVFGPALDNDGLSLDGLVQCDYVTMTDNIAHNRGGALETGTRSEIRHARFERNTAGAGSTSEGQGGAIHIYQSASITVSFTAFTSNVANKGGAISLGGGCTGDISHSSFVTNRAIGMGGAIAVVLSNINLESCTFWDNAAPSLGAALDADRPTSIRVVDSTFDPYEDGATTVFVRGRLGGCAEHPCSPGFSCSYEKYSISCSPCDFPQVGLDGITCSPCPASHGPNAAATMCEPCQGDTYSKTGVCQECGSTLVATPDHAGCDDCGDRQTAIFAATAESRYCGCADDWYNASAQAFACFAAGYEESWMALAGGAPDHSCDACPKDSMGGDCLICGAGQEASVSPGFHVPIPRINSRRQLAENDVTLVFRCHEDLEKAVLRCPGDLPTGECAEGHAGLLCGQCTDGYGMDSQGSCVECTEQNSGWLLAAGTLVGTSFALTVISKVWKQCPSKHLVRCSLQP
eukprot:COSAG06_NODE_2064_length_7686_cov_16.484249_4_plen_586_part_00